jgi:exopolyphosphatase/guanosine-5'-triphosphate,3'-diphosphate pyrophosphatase
VTAPLYAAIDCGTNSTRLLVSDGISTVERLMTVTRLGRDVDRTGVLAADSVARTLEVLAEYRERMDHHGVRSVRVAATSAVRDARNSTDFTGPAEELLGVAPEVLSGPEEAALSFLGATRDLPDSGGPYLVVDIGGGSTEFAMGTTGVEASASVQMGCVRMTEKHLHADPPLPEELTNCLAEVEFHLDGVLRDHPMMTAASTLVGLAGTITNVAAVEIGLAAYDPDAVHHFELTKAAVEDVFRTLATEALADRVHNPGLEEARADVIVGGMCVLVAILRNWGYESCLVSEADILDGLVASQLEGEAGS